MFERKNTENMNEWTIDNTPGRETLDLIADVLLHLPADTETLFIIPSGEEAKQIKAAYIRTGMALEENLICLRHIDAEFTLEKLVFHKNIRENDDLWQYENCNIRGKDKLSFVNEIKAAAAGATISVAYCLYRDRQRIASNKIIAEIKEQEGIWYAKCRIKDISEVKRIEEEMSLERKRFDTVSSLSGEWIFEYNVNRRNGLVQPRTPEITAGNGTKKREQRFIDGRTIYPKDRSRFFAATKRLLADGKQEYIELRMKTEQGEYEWHAIAARAIHDQNDETISIIGKVTNIHTQKMEELRLQEEAMCDPLTHVLNKKIFIERVKQQVAKLGDKYLGALAILDIDNFKILNDTQGHLFGDSVLVNMAEALKKSQMAEDLIGRFGGDEFIVYLHKCKDIAEITKRIEEVRGHFVSSVPVLPSQDKQITCSIGIAPVSGEDRRFEEIFDKADRALYYVKESGKNNYCLYNENLNFEYHSDNRKKLYETEKISSKTISDDITAFALELLEDSNDTESSVMLLLGKVGKRFGLSRITIVEKLPEQNDAEPTYQWADFEWTTDRPILKEMISEKNFVTLQQMMNKDGLIEITNISMLEKLPGLKEACIDRHIYSMVLCPLYYKSDLSGCIVYVCCDGEKEWSETQRKDLMSVSRIIRSHLEKENAYNRIDARVKHLVNYDEITGLYKESMFKVKVKEMVKSMNVKNRLGLIAVDLLEFGYFNECHGFRAGDKLLKDFAYSMVRMNPQVRLACRGYADNFILLLDVSDEMELEEVYFQYCDEFVEMQRKVYPEFNFELVAGGYLIQSNDTDVVMAIDNANLAKKARKALRRPGFQIFTVEMKAERLKEAALMNIIDEAIEDDEFITYLQPKIEIETGRLVGAEALARWKKPNGIITTPESFIPVLEKSGKIVKLDLYMYGNVVRILRSWKDNGYPSIPVSFNLSRHHIKNTRIVSNLLSIANAQQIPCDLLDIEITESAFVEDQEALIHAMEDLRNYGFGISIDDFGKGYSSLNMLTEIPADTIKLDKDFLKHSEEVASRSLVHNVIRLIKDSQMEIVCEGVETEEQAQFLSQAGCKYAQGFYYSRPIPVEEFEEKYFHTEEENGQE